MRSCPGTSLKAATVTLTISSALATPEVAAQAQRHQRPGTGDPITQFLGASYAYFCLGTARTPFYY
jgi:hypothetical protein